MAEIRFKNNFRIGKINLAMKKRIPLALFATASEINRRAGKIAPRFLGELKGSSEVERPTPKYVRFGFNKKYAEIMDRGWRVSVIRPRKAKALFIPLTRRAARIGPIKTGVRSIKQGRKPRKKRVSVGGLRRAIQGKFITKAKQQTNAEFIFRMKVKTRKAVKGSRTGPNYYFSGTIRDMSSKGEIARLLAKYIEKGLGP